MHFGSPGSRPPSLVRIQCAQCRPGLSIWSSAHCARLPPVPTSTLNLLFHPLVTLRHCATNIKPKTTFTHSITHSFTHLFTHFTDLYFLYTINTTQHSHQPQIYLASLPPFSELWSRHGRNSPRRSWTLSLSVQKSARYVQTDTPYTH